jgi:PAS domain S-box-containing protein
MAFRDLPIKRKLVGLMLVTSLLVLFMAGTAMLIYEYQSYRREMAAKLTAMGLIVANNSGAVLGFDDENLARAILSGFRVEPEVTGAAFYDAQGRLYARYPATKALGEFPPTVAEGETPGFHRTHFVLYVPVNQGEKRMGTLYVQADYRQMYRRLRTYLMILAGVLVSAGVLGLMLAAGIESGVSAPLLELANVAKIISRRRDYSLRVVKRSRDEVGTLTEAFNTMLGQIQSRDSKLRDSEKRFREMIDALPAAVYTVDPEGRLTHFNPAAVELAGRIPDLGTDRWCVSGRLYHTDGRPMNLEECPMALAVKEQRPVRDMEVIIERPDGTRCWVVPHPTTLWDADGRLTGGIDMLVDITERKNAEESLRKSEERFARFMQHLPGLAWIKDLGGRYVYANSAAADVFQVARERLYGRTDDEVFPPEIAATFKANDHAALASPIGVQMIEELKHRDGEIHHSIVNKFPIPAPDGRPLLVGGMAIDITDRKRAEEALQRSEARYRSIFEGVAVSLWEEDFTAVMEAVGKLRAQGVEDLRRYCDEHPGFLKEMRGLIRVVDVNESTVAMFEARDKSELLGALPDIFPDASLPVLAEELNALTAGSSFLQGEATLRTVQGNTIEVLFAMSLLPGTGEYDRVLFSLIDITRRKKVERALHESEHRFRMIADHIPVLAWTADPLGHGTWYNRQWHEYTGMAKDNEAGMGWEALHHPEHRARVLHSLEQSIAAGEPWQESFPMRGRQGQYRWFLSRAVPIFDDAGQLLRWFGTAVDVTDVREAEQLVAHLAAIVESSQDAILSETMDGRISTWNRGAERLFGYASEEVVGRSIAVIIPPERWDEDVAIRRRQAHGEGYEHFETVRVRKDGSRIVVSLSVSPIRDGTGATIGVSKIARDITDKKRAEEELERALQSARSANRSKDEFLAALSHELRTPLMPVLFTVSMWQQDETLPEKLRTNLGVIRRNIEIQSRMINDLLDLSRIRANRLELVFGVVDLHDIIGRAVEVCRGHPKWGEVSIQVLLEARAHHVRGDADRLQQVFWNLIQNGLKFTPAGGRITVQSSNQDRLIRVSVSDTGRGIEAESIDRIFEPFEQCGRRGKESLQGLGLGLAIAQRIVTSHGGSLTVASDGENQGAVFTVELEALLPDGPELEAAHSSLKEQEA